MRKRFLALFLTVAMVFTLVLTGCTSPAEESSEEPAEEPAVDPASESDGEISEEVSADAIKVVDENYEITTLVDGGNLYGGLNGLAFDNDDNLYVGAVAGASVFSIDTETGESSVFLGAPNGGADDIVFDDEGNMYWTTFFLGKVFRMDTEGNITVLAEGLAGANSLDLNDEGELFATQVFFGDVLWKIDTTGGMDNVKIGEGFGGLNGFEIGSDGYIYGPLWFKGQVAKVDTTTGEVVQVIVDDLNTPCAVNFDSKGNLIALDNATGEVFSINIETCEKTLIATQEPHLDNLAIDSNDNIFITNMNANGVYEVDAETGDIRTLTEDVLVLPQGVAVSTDDSGDTLYIGDNFTYKRIDAATGEVTCPENGSKYDYTASMSEDGNHVVMTGWNSGTIQVFNKSTDELEYTISGVPAPTSCYLLADGSMLALEGVTGNLVKITDQDYSTAEVIIEGLNGPTYMVKPDADETVVYVTEYSSGSITSIDYATGETAVICSELSGPEGIDVTAEGTLIVLDSVAQTLIEVDPATGDVSMLLENLPSGLLASCPIGPAASPLSDVAVADSGNIYFTCPMANNVYMLSQK